MAAWQRAPTRAQVLGTLPTPCLTWEAQSQGWGALSSPLEPSGEGALASRALAGAAPTRGLLGDLQAQPLSAGCATWASTRRSRAPLAGRGTFGSARRGVSTGPPRSGDTCSRPAAQHRALAGSAGHQSQAPPRKGVSPGPYFSGRTPPTLLQPPLGWDSGSRGAPGGQWGGLPGGLLWPRHHRGQGWAESPSPAVQTGFKGPRPQHCALQQDTVRGPGGHLPLLPPSPLSQRSEAWPHSSPPAKRSAPRTRKLAGSLVWSRTVPPRPRPGAARPDSQPGHRLRAVALMAPELPRMESRGGRQLGRWAALCRTPPPYLTAGPQPTTRPLG